MLHFSFAPRAMPHKTIWCVLDSRVSVYIHRRHSVVTASSMKPIITSITQNTDGIIPCCLVETYLLQIEHTLEGILALCCELLIEEVNTSFKSFLNLCKISQDKPLVS